MKGPPRLGPAHPACGSAPRGGVWGRGLEGWRGSGPAHPACGSGGAGSVSRAGEGSRGSGPAHAALGSGSGGPRPPALASPSGQLRPRQRFAARHGRAAGAAGSRGQSGRPGPASRLLAPGRRRSLRAAPPVAAAAPARARRPAAARGPRGQPRPPGKPPHPHPGPRAPGSRSTSAEGQLYSPSCTRPTPRPGVPEAPIPTSQGSDPPS